MHLTYRSYLKALAVFVLFVLIAYWLFNSIDTTDDESGPEMSRRVTSSTAVPAAVKPENKPVHVEGKTSFELNP